MARKIFASKVTSGGRVTVPKEVREHLGIKPGERLRFVFEGKQTIVRRNPFAKYAGTLGNFDGDINKINDWIRDMRRD